MLKNPIWLQMIFYVGTLFVLPVISLALLFSGGYLISSEGGASAVPILFFGALFAYVTVVSVFMVPFISAEVKHDEQGMTLIKGDKKTRYKWTDFSKTKHYGVIGITYMYDNDGSIVFVVSTYTPGYKAFAHKVNAEVGIRS